MPEWQLTVDYKADYELEDVSPDSMYELATRAKNSQSFASIFNWHKSRKVGVPRDTDEAG